MSELKVFCDCGQKYKFDVEPVNGRMPFAVSCPICGCDGTTKANELLQQMTVFKPLESSSAPAPESAPPPGTSTPNPPPSKLRLNVSAAPPQAAPPAIGSAPPIAPVIPPPIGGISRKPVATPADKSGKPPSFALGLVGALIGASVGAALYFTIYKITGPFFLLRYILALGVGGLAGWLANLLGKGEGSKELGGLAAVFTIVGILGAQYFLALGRLHADEDLNNVNQAIADGGYAMSVKEAKAVVTAIPTGSDAEIRIYIAKEQAEDGQPPKPEAISSDEVKQFRDTELTNYIELASGKLSKEAFWAKSGFDPEAAKKILDSEDKTVTGLAVVLAVLKAGVFSMIAGAGLAYKLSANA